MNKRKKVALRKHRIKRNKEKLKSKQQGEAASSPPTAS